MSGSTVCYGNGCHGNAASTLDQSPVRSSSVSRLKPLGCEALGLPGSIGFHDNQRSDFWTKSCASLDGLSRSFSQRGRASVFRASNLSGRNGRRCGRQGALVFHG
uniref:Uncharacterized protein n=1 Tax=Knipowitschia caucasica TaxID=637954 RepID=A0AAV2LJQ5_KNICA